MDTPTTSHPSSRNSSPQKSRRTGLLVLGGVATVILIGLLVYGTVFLIRRSANETGSDSFFGNLPFAQDRDELSSAPDTGVSQESSETHSPTSTPTTPILENETVPPLSYVAGQNLTVTIDVTQDSFEPATIRTVRQTGLRPNNIALPDISTDIIELYTVRVFSENRQFLIEHSFAAPTTAQYEEWPTLDAVQATTDEIDQITVDITFPAATVSGARFVDVVTSEGNVSDQYVIPNSVSFGRHSFLDVITQKARSVWNSVTGNTLYAQSGCPNPFFILVTNERTPREAGDVQGSLQAALASTQSMLSKAPWNDFRDCIQVAALYNDSYPMGCAGTRGIYCTNKGGATALAREAELIGEEEEVQLAVVVVSGVQCGVCGEAGIGSGIFGISPEAAQIPEAIAHEAGHATGLMTDEYGYLFGGVPFSGPNCFSSISQCESKSQQSGLGFECIDGCYDNSTVRPATKIMHGTLSAGQYGLWEQCLLRNVLASVIDVPDRADPNCDTPGPPGGDGGDIYYGWRR